MTSIVVSFQRDYTRYTTRHSEMIHNAERDFATWQNAPWHGTTYL